jgi:Septum formation
VPGGVEGIRVTGLAARILIIGVIVVGGIVFRDRLSGSAGDLKAGDCFDIKAATEIKSVQHHPCTEAHTAEVVLAADYPAAKGAAYPSDAGFDAWGDGTCVAAILKYVGPTANLDAFNYGTMVPKASDWNTGERGMICYLTRVDQAPMTKSLRAGAS